MHNVRNNKKFRIKVVCRRFFIRGFKESGREISGGGEKKEIHCKAVVADLSDDVVTVQQHILTGVTCNIS